MKKHFGMILVYIAYMVCGALCSGYGYKLVVAGRPAVEGIGSQLMLSGFVLFILIAAIYAQIIVHEGGHLLMGLASGYRFCSFRIGNHIFLKQDGKLVRKKFTIAGTGGQCLLYPPDCPPEECPFFLYNIGGAAANFLSAIIAGLILRCFPAASFFSAFLFDTLVVGIVLGALNAIPLKLGGIANDGCNISQMRRDRRARWALWLQLHINGLITEGTRLRDMDEALFQLQPGDDLNNPLIGAIEQYRLEYLMDKREFPEAEKLCRSLLRVPGLMDQQRNEINCTLLFLELIGERRPEAVNRIYRKRLAKYIKVTACYVSRRRLMYAYELLFKQNEDEARKQLAAFEKTAETYPFRGEIEGERELITLIDERAAQLTADAEGN